MKVIIGTDIGSYVFDPTNRKVSLFGIPMPKLEQFVLITNVTQGVIVYNFADPTANVATLLDNDLTLEYDTSSHNATDRLQIIIDLPASALPAQSPVTAVPVVISDEAEYTFTYDAQLNQLFGGRPLVTPDGRVRAATTADSVQANGTLGVIGKELRVWTAAYPVVGIEISGTWTGTIAFEGTVDGGNWYALAAAPSAGGATVGSTTASGMWVVSSAGLLQVRLRCSAAMTGAAICALLAANGQSVWPTGTDANLQTVLGTAAMYRPISDVPVGLTAPVALTAAQLLLSPTRNSKDPQYFPRLRVEAGGDQKLPLAQELVTNRLVIASPELLRTLEEINMRLGLLGNALAAAGFSPEGWEELK